MFDMLDDDLDIGYVPTITNNSRSASMKKLSKKQPKVQSKQTINTNKNQKNNDFDDLLDDLLEKQYKNPAPVPQSKKNSTKNVMANSYDSLLDESKPTVAQNNKKITNPEPPKNPSLFKAFNTKNDWSEDIISQDVGLSFGKNQSAAPVAKNEEVFVSSRNMKPPLKKKNDSNLGLGQSISFGGGGSLNLLLPEESRIQNKINEDDNIIKPPPRLMNRRSSIDKNQDSQLSRNDYSPSLSLELTKQPSRSLDNKGQTNRNQGLKLSLQQPSKVENKYEKKDDFIKPSYPKQSYQFKKQQEITKEDKPIQQFQRKIVEQPKKTFNNMVQDQSLTLRQTSNQPTSSNQQTISTNKAMNQDFQRQVNEVKKTFQKQIDFLQQNLEKQININKQTRQKLMKQTDRMIEQQRRRSQLIHQQEIKRMKQMFQWQKTRTEENYKRQIDSLRENLDFANKNNNLNYIKPHYSAKEDSQYHQIQLKNQKKFLDDKQKIIQKREMALQERQMEMTKRKRKQQQRLRMEQKRIIELQSQIKLQKLRDRKILDEEKHQIALQMAKIQIQAMRKEQKVVIEQKSNKIDQKALQHEKVELRGMNADLIQKYKKKLEEVQAQRQHIKQLQQKLIQKIRIVQKKGKQFSQTNQHVNQTTYAKKENNWLQQKDKSFKNIRKFTIEKQDQQTSLQNAHKTKQRFHNIQDYTKNRMNVKVKDKQKFNIDDFLINVNHHNKLKA